MRGGKGNIPSRRALKNKICIGAYLLYLADNARIIENPLANAALLKRTVFRDNAVLYMENAYPVTERLQTLVKNIIHIANVGFVNMILILSLSIVFTARFSVFTSKQT